MCLSDIIIQSIKKDGALSFRDFMDMCLYYPDLGYYTCTRDKIGATGDFYTSSSLTATFGAMLARQLEKMWLLLGKGTFTVVEYGAGTGILCHDIIEYLKGSSPLYKDVRYCIIEKSPDMQRRQKLHLSEKVSWHESIDEIAGFTGCVLSNELVDNFPVHQIIMADEVMEVFVNYKDRFIEELRPASDVLKNYLSELQVVLPPGFRTEINIQATEWIEEIGASLDKGFIITMDYGYPSSELYKDHRRSGTLVCYRHHSVNYNPYQYIGEQDITTHINFSALCHWGDKNHLSFYDFTDQSHFLMDLGWKEYRINLKINNVPGNNGNKEERFLEHILLNDLGKKILVLIQRKL